MLGINVSRGERRLEYAAVHLAVGLAQVMPGIVVRAPGRAVVVAAALLHLGTSGFAFGLVGRRLSGDAIGWHTASGRVARCPLITIVVPVFPIGEGARTTR